MRLRIQLHMPRGGRTPGTPNKGELSSHPKTVANRIALEKKKMKEEYMVSGELFATGEKMLPTKSLFPHKFNIHEDKQEMKTTAKKDTNAFYIGELHKRLGNMEGDDVVDDNAVKKLAKSGTTHSNTRYVSMLQKCVTLPCTVDEAKAALLEKHPWLEMEDDKENQVDEAKDLEKHAWLETEDDKENQDRFDIIERDDDASDGDVRDVVLITSKEMLWKVICDSCGIHNQGDHVQPVQQFVEFCRSNEIDPIVAYREVCFDILNLNVFYDSSPPSST